MATITSRISDAPVQFTRALAAALGVSPSVIATLVNPRALAAAPVIAPAVAATLTSPRALAAALGISPSVVATLKNLVVPQLRTQIRAAVTTLGGTLRATGGGPAVTLTGSGALVFGAGLCPKIKVSFTANGTAGSSGTMQVSYTSGAGSPVYTVSPIPTSFTLGGLGAGATLNLSGAYTTSHSYETTVETLRSTEGNLYTFTQAVAATQPVLRDALVAPDGKDSLFFAGSQWLVSTDAALITLFTNDPARTVMARVAYTAANPPAGAGYWLSAMHSGFPNSHKVGYGQVNTGSGREFITWSNDASVAATRTCTTDPLTGGTAAHTLCWYGPGSNGGINLKVNDVTEATDAVTMNIGTNTPDNVALGGAVDSTPAQGLFGYISDLGVWSSSLSASRQTAWVAEMTS